MSSDFKKGFRLGAIVTAIVCGVAVIVRDILDEKSLCAQLHDDAESSEDGDETDDFDDFDDDEEKSK